MSEHKSFEGILERTVRGDSAQIAKREKGYLEILLLSTTWTYHTYATVLPLSPGMSGCLPDIAEDEYTKAEN